MNDYNMNQKIKGKKMKNKELKISNGEKKRMKD